MHNSNGNCKQKLLSYRTIPVLPPLINPGVDRWIAPIILTPQTLLTSATKEKIMDAGLGGAWTSRTLQIGSRTGVNRRTTVDIGNAIGIVETSSPVLTGIILTTTLCGLNLSQEVVDIQKFTSQGLVRKS